MGNYVDADDVRAEGVPSSVQTSAINRRIVKWEAIVEQLTRNIFRIISPGELTFDGNDATILHFNLPLVTVTSVKINDDETVLDTDSYRAFTGRTPPQDNRRNPKIELRPQVSSVYTRNQGIFVKGLDQLITATWGFVESDDSTPQPVKDAIVALVCLDIDGYFDRAASGGGGLPVTPMKREKTDDHEVEYQATDNVTSYWSMIPRDIADILAMYRAPLAIAVPSLPRFLAAHSYGVSIYAS